jgi:hypothetical protein
MFTPTASHMLQAQALLLDIMLKDIPGQQLCELETKARLSVRVFTSIGSPLLLGRADRRSGENDLPGKESPNRSRLPTLLSCSN